MCSRGKEASGAAMFRDEILMSWKGNECACRAGRLPAREPPLRRRTPRGPVLLDAAGGALARQHRTHARRAQWAGAERPSYLFPSHSNFGCARRKGSFGPGLTEPWPGETTEWLPVCARAGSGVTPINCACLSCLNRTCMETVPSWCAGGADGGASRAAGRCEPPGRPALGRARAPVPATGATTPRRWRCSGRSGRRRRAMWHGRRSSASSASPTRRPSSCPTSGALPPFRSGGACCNCLLMLLHGEYLPWWASHQECMQAGSSLRIMTFCSSFTHIL